MVEKQASSEIAQSREPDLGPNWGKGGSSADVEGMFSVIGLRKALAHSEANLKEAVRRKRVKDQIIRDLRNKLAAAERDTRERCAQIAEQWEVNQFLPAGSLNKLAERIRGKELSR